jgi:hypothetical protein
MCISASKYIIVATHQYKDAKNMQVYNNFMDLSKHKYRLIEA